ncbi:hypothetical protein BDN72DRAFT_781697 [Pluteus cervinus]|uniref:Uncharacterized protein n=2 Tax=Pluteus cervinus TaxID=181527 RepID=A0ACD2ZZV4_9AGAR|nr:hypothetical protein BDN72DRAFT_781747 [Pluteus cervinus]TFK58715.1 hypothetical protein BDN72DRAFT_781697 [Pluteus cervinus]
MHLVFVNLIKNLVLLWTGKFKGLDEGSGEYVLSPKTWEEIGSATALSGSTIPSAYGARPQNVADDKVSCTADSWSFWMQYIGPVVLNKRFRSSIYYDHFLDLVRLIRLCLQFELKRGEIVTIRVGFQRWVTKYEELYYQHDPNRAATCPVTIHALLHIADGIEEAGPVWTYWAFPMERFCGFLQPSIKSRRFPFANIDNYVVSSAQLTQIKNRYNLYNELLLKPAVTAISRREYSVPAYQTCVLLPPRVKSPELPVGIIEKIVVSLATRYNVSMAKSRKHFSIKNLQLFGRVERLDGGDIMTASLVKKSTAEDRRDASFVRYEQLVDKNARRRNAPVDLTPETFYGQLQYLFVVEVPATRDLGLASPETLILACIHTCDVEAENSLDMHYYKKQGRVEVVDVTTVQCLVGRVKVDKKWWAIIDRSGGMARPEFVDPSDSS